MDEEESEEKDDSKEKKRRIRETESERERVRKRDAWHKTGKVSSNSKAVESCKRTERTKTYDDKKKNMW